MSLTKKVKQSLPIETEAYKAEQKFLAKAEAQRRLDAGEVLTDPKDFPPNTPADVVAVSAGNPVRMKEKGTPKMSTATVTKLPPAKAKNSKTTADVKNPKSAAKAAPAKKAPAKKAAKAEGEGRGRTSVYSGKTLVASAEALKTNPRREGTNGYRFFEVVRKAGKKGIKYEELRAHKDFGNNHLAWDVDHGNILAK